MKKYFGTDGIRATFNNSFLNEDFAFSLGRALALFIQKNKIHGKQVLIGRDTRPSGNLLLHAFHQGLKSCGYKGFSAGILPTPALAFGTMEKKMAMGVMITASHNPVLDNGFKFFSSTGTKLEDSQETEIEALISPHQRPNEVPDTKFLKVTHSYLDHIQNFFPDDLLQGKKVVVDVSNGATHETSPHVLEKLGAEIKVFNNGTGNINADVGSEYPLMMAGKVKELNADFGIAHDGDGDRVIFCDSTGKIILGDKILGILALNEHQNQRLNNNGFVATIHSNSGLDASLQKHGIALHRSDVGDKNVAALMRKKGINMGGESSGHVVASDYLPTGDGLITALLVARASYEKKQTIDLLSKEIILWPSIEGSFKVIEKKPIEECEILHSCLLDVKSSLGKSGRVLLRYSGTEPKIRLLVEAIDQSMAKAAFDRLANTIDKCL
ncbi:MAG: phosphoglucosamine mutase [Opitutales bacterium]|nr:phosphoglucosamine mutase [Opitutales bacterium]